MENKFELKSKIYFNEQSLQLLEKVKGFKAFIVSDSVIEKLGYLQKTKDYLKNAGLDSVVFTGVHPDPDVQVIANAMKLYQKANADVIVAIGGGSTIDTAKGILYFAWNMANSAGQKIKKPLFIAIPSTSGTGSEVTDFTVITSHKEKVCIVDNFIAPDVAILDSTCIRNVPQRVMVDTGLDVLVHGIEAYVSKNATDFTDALAEKAVKLIFENIQRLYKDSDDSEARNHVQNASCMAGIAFTNAGLGINHSLAHALGGAFHISHGRANALLLNEVIKYNGDLYGNINNSIAERYAKLASVIQIPARTIREGAVGFIQAVSELKRSLGVEEGIAALGINENKFQEMVERMSETAMGDRCTPTNPREVSKKELLAIYQNCY